MRQPERKIRFNAPCSIFSLLSLYTIAVGLARRTYAAIEFDFHPGHNSGQHPHDGVIAPFRPFGVCPDAEVLFIARHLGYQIIEVPVQWYYDGNSKSKRVQEKLGFKYQWTSEGVDVPLMHEKRTGHVNLMTAEDWETIR